MPTWGRDLLRGSKILYGWSQLNCIRKTGLVDGQRGGNSSLQSQLEASTIDNDKFVGWLAIGTRVLLKKLVMLRKLKPLR